MQRTGMWKEAMQTYKHNRYLHTNYMVSWLKQVRPPSVQGAADLLGDYLAPHQLPRGIREIQHLDIYVDFGHICGRDLRRDAPSLMWICYRGWGYLLIALHRAWA